MLLGLIPITVTATDLCFMVRGTNQGLHEKAHVVSMFVTDNYYIDQYVGHTFMPTRGYFRESHIDSVNIIGSNALYFDSVATICSPINGNTL